MISEERATGLHDRLLTRIGVEHEFGARDSPIPERIARVRQVHGDRVVTAREPTGADAPERLPEADALATDRVGLGVAIVTADCVPVLVATRDGRAVAAIHAGWRGLAAGVVGRGIEALGRLAPSASLVAAVGPRIGPCCYEVDRPVMQALHARCGADALRQAAQPSRPGHSMLDLELLVASELTRAGVEAAGVSSTAALCTYCDAGRFHSVRRDGVAAGRLLHYIRAAQ